MVELITVAAILFVVWVMSRGQVIDQILDPKNWDYFDDQTKFTIRETLKQLRYRHKFW